jgi:2'-5' RNA ligase
MRIKKYIQFIKESSGYEYGCVMVEVPVKNWKEITSYIDPEDVYTGGDDTHGIQENPHVTILYGLHKEVTPEMIKSVFDNFTDNINIVVDGIDIFENEDYDVVKFNVKADGALQYLHDELSKFPNSNSFPDYKPHITICYVKKGSGKKYIKPEYKYEVKNVDKITYSMPSGEKVKFDYKINESLKHGDLEYDSEWKLPTSPIRKELESYLRNFLLELEDLGYRPQIKGFIKSDAPYNWNHTSKPYIWIKNQRRLTHDEFWNEIDPIVETIKSYLESEGFSIDIRILKMKYEEVYIYFDKNSNI